MRELLEIRIGIGFIHIPAGGWKNTTIADGQQDRPPSLGIHPDVRIVCFGIFAIMKKGLLRQLFSDRTDRAARLQSAGKGLVHTTLKMKSVVENHVGSSTLARSDRVGWYRWDQPGRHRTSTWPQSPTTAFTRSPIIPVVARHRNSAADTDWPAAINEARNITAEENSHTCSIGYKNQRPEPN